MQSWWELGEWSGYEGSKLALHRITCPFCDERGNFKVAHHAEKKKPNGRKTLNFDTLECANCRGYVMCLWSANHDIHDFRVLPRPLKYDKHPEHWPSSVGRYWLQAKRSVTAENWDAAAVMTRSAMQVALRDKGAQGTNLKQEIDDLANKGVLPPIMKDWANTLRELGNDSAHPQPSQDPTGARDAQDIVRYLDFLLEYLYDLPKQIEEYRARSAPTT
jgi:sarcosine oxidase delta subunit